MMLLESNIIIYAAQPDGAALREFIVQHAPAVSIISYIEVLGYHRLTDEARVFLERFFQAAVVLPLTDEVAQRAVTLRQRRRLSLGDAIVAATALVHGHSLLTHNTSDFDWISELTVYDPLS